MNIGNLKSVKATLAYYLASVGLTERIKSNEKEISSFLCHKTENDVFLYYSHYMSQPKIIKNSLRLVAALSRFVGNK